MVNVEVLEPEKAQDVKGPAKLVSFTQRSLQHKDSVVCHSMGFPSQLYSCHVVSKTKVLEGVLILTANASVSRVVFVCHMGTKAWDPSFEGFTILKVQPGTPICHWVDPDTLVWVVTKLADRLVQYV